jgi:vacuolar-type H+-ATPase subunit I/STV1
MAETSQISAWIVLFMGLYSLAAAVGEMRSPNTWWTMLKDFERSAALRFLTGFFVLSLGAAIYLVNPWVPGDWLSVAVSVLGGVMVAEGLLILAAGDRFLHMARALIGRAGRAWAGFAALLGFAMIVLALSRLQVVCAGQARAAASDPSGSGRTSAAASSAPSQAKPSAGLSSTTWRLWYGAMSGPGGQVSSVNASPTCGSARTIPAMPNQSWSGQVNSQRSLRFALGSSGAVNS